ncbi:MAG: hypothetical protein ACJA0V_002036 [Planctomycetota bacterium]|jgi:hypothetical protein
MAVCSPVAQTPTSARCSNGWSRSRPASARRDRWRAASRSQGHAANARERPSAPSRPWLALAPTGICHLAAAHSQRTGTARPLKQLLEASLACRCIDCHAGDSRRSQAKGRMPSGAWHHRTCSCLMQPKASNNMEAWLRARPGYFSYATRPTVRDREPWRHGDRSQRRERACRDYSDQPTQSGSHRGTCAHLRQRPPCTRAAPR